MNDSRLLLWPIYHGLRFPIPKPECTVKMSWDPSFTKACTTDNLNEYERCKNINNASNTSRAILSYSRFELFLVQILGSRFREKKVSLSSALLILDVASSKYIQNFYFTYCLKYLAEGFMVD